MTESLLNRVPVIPVVVVDDVDHAIPIARALVAGGLPVIELTLRTPVALDAIERIAGEVPEIFLGAGTIVDPGQAKQAASAGAQFLVSPGSTRNLLGAMTDTGLPHLPGVATVSEILTALEAGYTELKFFPAEAAGGANYLKSVSSPIPAARFCPTGGITTANAAQYLALPNVGCVGGSWITPVRRCRKPRLGAHHRPGRRRRRDALTPAPNPRNYDARVRAGLVAAHAALDEAVAILRDGRARPHERITKAAKDFLTDVDLASESAMQRSLAASTPEIGYYGEESGGPALDSGKVWVADPLDGTINYATGSPLCGVML
jgi:2-dehydro-3-deoxyphosphogluconate aldolase / (4S)-4-hydroxy-2-oxoglutarate aldolase